MSSQPSHKPDGIIVVGAENFAWKTLVLAIVVIAAYTAITLLFLLNRMSLALGMLAASGLYYVGYTVFHEAVHGNIHGKSQSLRWINDIIGYIMGQILCVSFCAHKKQHLRNHNHRNEPSHRERGGLVREAIAVAKLQYRDFFTQNWLSSAATERREVIAEMALMLFLRGALIVIYTPLETTIFFIGSLVLGVLILIFLFIWLVHPSASKEHSYQNTITFIFPKPIHKLLTWLWLFQNYHIIHHLFPRVPFYKYQNLFHDIESDLVAMKAEIIRF